MEQDERDLLIRVDTTVQNMHSELLGAPGRKGRISVIEETQADHTSQINFWRGVVWVIAGLFAILGTAFAAHIWK